MDPKKKEVKKTLKGSKSTLQIKFKKFLIRRKYKKGILSLSERLNIVLSKLEPHQLAILSFDHNECEKFFKYNELFQSENKKMSANREENLLSSKPLKELLLGTAANKMSCDMKKVFRKKLRKEIIDNAYRQEFWINVSGANRFFKDKQNEYSLLIDYYDDYPDYFMQQIDMDLKRTLNERFLKNGTSKHDGEIDKIHHKMERVLFAYSKRNPFVGYCQGLNFIIAWIMKNGFEEEEAYSLLVSLIETILPLDYYTTMTGVIIDQKIFEEMVKQFIPDLGKKFKQIELDISIFSVPWFVCLFTSTNLREDVLKVIWDQLLVEGSVVLLKAGLLILKELKPFILKAREFPEALKIIEENITCVKDVKEFHKRLNNTYISKKILKIAREKYREKILQLKQEQSIRFKVKSRIKLSEKKVECNKEWPLCKQVLEKAKIVKVETDFFVFRQAVEPDVIKDWFVDCPSERERLESEDSSIKVQKTKKMLVIGRHEHICFVPELHTEKSSEEEIVKEKEKVVLQHDASSEGSEGQTSLNLQPLQNKLLNITSTHKYLSKNLKTLENENAEAKEESMNMLTRRRSISFCEVKHRKQDLDQSEYDHSISKITLETPDNSNIQEKSLNNSFNNNSTSENIFPENFDDFCKLLEGYKKDEKRDYDNLMDLFPLMQGWNIQDFHRAERSVSVAFVKNLNLFKMD